MGSKTSLVIVGFGLIGKRHAEAITHFRNIEIIGIVEPSNISLESGDFKNLRVYKNMAEMFSSIKPDGIIIATPTGLHMEHALEAISNNSPILLEKPIAASLEEAQIIVKASEENKVPLLIGHHRRHNPLIQKAAEIIKSGKLGRIRAVHANCWFYKPDDYFEAGPWRKGKGGSPVLLNLTHDIDLLRYLCGDITSVQAQSVKSVRGHDNNDTSVVLLSFANGAIGTVSISDSICSPWSWELTSHENPAYPQTMQSCYYIGGDRGSLSIPDLRIWSNEGEADWWKPMNSTYSICETSDPLINQIEHFVNVIKGNANPMVTGYDGVKNMQVIEAIETASQSGIICNVDD